MSPPEQIADGVFRLGTEWVNWYLCAADDGIVIVDCGFRDYAEQLPGALREIGRSEDEVAAVVLTHYHPDHAGAAQRIREATGARVSAPVGDAEGLRTGRIPTPRGLVTSLWRPAMARYAAHIVRSGGMARVPVAEVGEYAEGALAGLPLPLTAIPAPGHTGGHCALLAEDYGVLFVGDALSNVDFFTREPRVHVLPFNEDSEVAVRSITRLAAVPAQVVAFGHGDPLRASPAEVVARA